MSAADRELLRLAAKAARVCGFFVDAGINTGSDAEPVIWNPLTDDGDAFRLAITVGINVFKGMAEVQRHGIGRVWADESEVAKDPVAATRRAIVRAAAEIGRAMP